MSFTTAAPNPTDDGWQRESVVSAEAAADVLQAAGRLAGDAGRLGAAWLELARAEMRVARLSAWRLALGGLIGLVLGFGVWLFASLALAFWLGSLMRMDLALLTVAFVNGTAIAVLAFAMRRWWHALHMPNSRAALGEMARTLSS